MKEIESSSSIKRLSRRSRVLTVVGITALAGLLMPLGSGGDGIAVPVAHNLDVLAVANGYHSRLTEIYDRLGVPELTFITGGRDGANDRFISAANAYGVATNLVTGRTTAGIMLTVTPHSPAREAGLLSRDVVREIRFAASCNAPADLYARWVATGRCASTLTVGRSGEVVSIELPARSAIGASGTKVRTDDTTSVPRQLTSSSGLSAGLVLSLLYTDRLTPGDLFSSDHVAGSGVANVRTGGISTISGLPVKAVAAHAAGATILFVPQGQSREIGTFPGMPVYEVTTTEQAVRLLCLRGAQDSICERYPNSP